MLENLYNYYQSNMTQEQIENYQRFGEGLRLATDRLNSKNFYAFNPEFDR